MYTKHKNKKKDYVREKYKHDFAMALQQRGFNEKGAKYSLK